MTGRGEAMDCDTIRERGIADEYLAGRLPPEEAEAYEEHYFGCDRCLEELQFRKALAAELREHGEELFAGEIVQERAAEARSGGVASDRARRGWFSLPDWLTSPRPAWGLAAAAAVALLVVVVLNGRGPDQAERLRDLWTPVAYPYVAAELRGGADLTAFEQGMEHYQAGRYGEAAALLARHVETESEDHEALFYLGVSRLLSEEPETAVGDLERARRLVPSSKLYLWHLAQAELEAERPDDAERHLRELTVSGGAFAEEAARLLAEMEGVR
ncbi:MAG: CDC27 family protein [Candidatus Eisenbacteria sp.]|nr:CDC27 family protein [Candidatus Eisenbacteria bacterium]